MKDFFDELKLRITNPLVSAFFISLIFCNIKVPLVLFFYKQADLKRDHFDSYLDFIHKTTDVFTLLIFPMTFAIFYIWFSPHVRAFIKSYIAKTEAKHNAKLYDDTSEDIITMEEHRRILTKKDEKRLEYIAMVNEETTDREARAEAIREALRVEHKLELKKAKDLSDANQDTFRKEQDLRVVKVRTDLTAEKDAISNQMQSQAANHQTDRNNLLNEKEALVQRVHILKETNTQLEDSYILKVGDLETTNNSLTNQIKELDSAHRLEVIKYRDTIDNRHKDIETLVKSNSDLLMSHDLEVIELKKTISNYERSLSDISYQKTLLINERDSLIVDNTNKQEQILEQFNRISSLEVQNQSYEGFLIDNNNQITTLKTQIQLNYESEQLLNQHINELNNDKVALEQEKINAGMGLSEEITTYMRRLGSLQAKLEIARMKAEQLKSNIYDIVPDVNSNIVYEAQLLVNELTIPTED